MSQTGSWGRYFPSHGERVVVHRVRDKQGEFWVFMSVRRDGTEVVLGAVEKKA